MSMQLAQLYRYPVKSLAGEARQSVALEPWGLAGDRQWMLVDEQGRFLSQRELPQMALIRPRAHQGHWILSAPGMPDLQIEDDPTAAYMEVTVWKDTLLAQMPDPKANHWLSQFLGRSCRLVRWGDKSRRQVDLKYARKGEETAFSDGFPLLLISQASLDDLNQRLPKPLSMIRFRPNLVISGCAPYAEDQWRRIRIGGIEFRVVKPCSRCVIPTIDPGTGRREGNEPLKTLMTYRKQGNQVYFGQNLIHEGLGRLEVGMPVDVLA